MPQKLKDSLSGDHDWLDSLLSRADGESGVVELESYVDLRKGLLKHVGMEELILLPSVRRLTGQPARLTGRIRLDYGALTALLVPTPTPAIVKAIKSILTVHNGLEERANGLYQECQAALGERTAAVLAEFKNARYIPPAAHADGPSVMAVVRRALAEAGYSGALV